jgi:hypothetical protein
MHLQIAIYNKTFKIITVLPVMSIGQFNKECFHMPSSAKKSLFMNLKINKLETNQSVLPQRRNLFICHVFDFYTELG